VATSVYKLTDEEISDKAGRIIDKLRLSGNITGREADILNTCIGRYISLSARIETTVKWAQEAFDEQKRLTELLKERWEAGWKGDANGLD